MVIEHKIVLDFARTLKSDTITVSKGDADSRKITLLLFADGEPLDLSDVTSAVINANTNDIAEVSISATVDEDGHLAYFTLPADLTNVAGKRSYTLTLITDYTQITSPEWYINVVSQLRDDSDALTREDILGFQETLARIEDMYEAAQQTTSTLPNPYALTITIGNNTYSYDGSEAVGISFVDGNEMSF